MCYNVCVIKLKSLHIRVYFYIQKRTCVSLDSWETYIINVISSLSYTKMAQNINSGKT